MNVLFKPVFHTFGIILLFWTHFLYAQNSNNNIHFKHLSIDDGLSDIAVTSIAQGPDGFMWFGTNNGLNRYDGNTFKWYHADQKDTMGLPANSINVIYKAQNNVLWIGTRKGLCRYLPDVDKFKTYVHEPAKGASLSNNYVFSVTEDENGGLWIGTWYGLNKWNPDKQQFDRYIIDKNRETSNIIYKVFLDSRNNLWLGTDNGLFLFDKDEGKVVRHYQHIDDNEYSLPHHYVQEIYEDNDSNLWIGTKKGGLSLFDRDKELFYNFRYDQNTPTSISHNDVRQIHQDSKGNLWVGTLLGINLFDYNKQSFTNYTNNYNDPNSLSQNAIWSIYEDNQGGIWIGTWAGGVNYYHPSMNFFKHYAYSSGKNGLSNNQVQCMVEGLNGNIWIGTYKGLNCLDPSTDKNKIFLSERKKAGTIDNNMHTSIADNNITSLCADQNNDLWIGTKHILNHYNQKQGRFYYYPHHISTNENKQERSYRGFEYNYIEHIKTGKNNIWLGIRGAGLVKFDRKTKLFTDCFHSKEDSLIDFNTLKLLYNDSKNNFWFSNDGRKNLVKFETATNKLHYYSVDDTAQQQLKPKLTCMVETTQGQYLIGTSNNGLFRFYNKTGLSYKDTMVSIDQITQIIKYKENEFWLGTKKGIVRLNMNTGEYWILSGVYGLKQSSFLFKTSLKSSDGTIYFGGENGVYAFDPEKIRKNSFVPPVIITEFELFNNPVPVGKPGEAKAFVLKKPVYLSDKIMLRYDQNYIGFRFAALNFLYPEKNQYAYMLKGIDKSWNYTDNQATAGYKDLSPGEYVFKVKGANNDGVWNNKPASVHIVILPPWWKTWWFRAVLFVIIILSMAGIYFYRISQIKRYNVQLKKEVNEQTQQIQVQNQELSSQADALQEKNIHLRKNQKELNKKNKALTELNATKDKLFSIIAHDLRGPFQGILNCSRLLSEKIDQADIPELKKYVETLQESSHSTHSLLENLLDWARSQSRDIRFEPVTFNLNHLLRENIQLVKGNAKKKDITVSLEEQANVNAFADMNMTATVMRNLINNAVKFTYEKGSINISLSKDDKWAKVVICDTGTGMDQTTLDNLFKINKPVQKNGTFGETGTGLGLIICKEFIENNKGTIHVESNTGEGTCFTVQIPASDKVAVKKDAAHQNIVRKFSSTGQTLSKTFDDHEERSVLVVEDNDNIRAGIKRLFPDNYKVFEAPDGLKGWSVCVEKIPDVIISDVMMPQMDGFTLCRKIKTDERTSHIPVILLTAKTEEANKIRGLETGADVYITKPFNDEILVMQLKNILSSQDKFRNKLRKEILLKPAAKELNSTDRRFLSKMVEVLDRKIDDPQFDVEELVNETAMSRTQLYRKIKALSGQSVKEFIKDYRLKKAATLLREKNYNVSEVTYKVGFNNRSYFTKCFKEMFGVLPSEYT